MQRRGRPDSHGLLVGLNVCLARARAEDSAAPGPQECSLGVQCVCSCGRNIERGSARVCPGRARCAPGQVCVCKGTSFGHKGVRSPRLQPIPRVCGGVCERGSSGFKCPMGTRRRVGEPPGSARRERRGRRRSRPTATGGRPAGCLGGAERSVRTPARGGSVGGARKARRTRLRPMSAASACGRGGLRRAGPRLAGGGGAGSARRHARSGPRLGARAAPGPRPRRRRLR